MNVRPLIVRELRAEARRTNTYLVRSLAAGFLTLVTLWAITLGGAGGAGNMLFGWMMEGLLVAVLVIVAALTGDSISREKREGTLGLLFLTPLRAREIILGKTLLHGVRAIAIFLAVTPILGLPFLLGGITSDDLIASIVMQTSIFVLAVACGMVATVHNTEWIQSIASSVLLCVALSAIIFFFAGRLPYAWPAFPISLLVLIAALWHAGRRLRTTWQSDTSEREPRWVRIFAGSEFWRAFFKWDTRKARDRNPIAWLQEYNWSSRLTKWGWCFLLFAAEMQLFFRFRPYVDYQMTLYRLTALGIAFSAAASFRRERQTGALELLLVTPISAGQLIWGRLQGVWFHFFPAIAILTCVWMMGPDLLSLPIRYAWYLAGAYLCIPIVGFYCSLFTSNVLLAWGMTLVFTQLIPHFATQAFRFEIGRRNIPFAFVIIQIIFAIVATFLLFENLKIRRFALRRV